MSCLLRMWHAVSSRMVRMLGKTSDVAHHGEPAMQGCRLSTAKGFASDDRPLHATGACSQVSCTDSKQHDRPTKKACMTCQKASVRLLIGPCI